MSRVESRILCVLKEEALYFNEIKTATGFHQSSLTNRLQKLTRAGKTINKKVGKYSLYSLIENKSLLDERVKQLRKNDREIRLSNSRKTTRYAKSDECTVREVFVPDEHDFAPVPRLPFPIDGFVAVKIYNATDTTFGGCTAKISTDKGNYPLYLWPRIGLADEHFTLRARTTTLLHTRVKAASSKSVNVKLDTGEKEISYEGVIVGLS